jgi:hypothetical protein
MSINVVEVQITMRRLQDNEEALEDKILESLSGCRLLSAVQDKSVPRTGLAVRQPDARSPDAIMQSQH